MVSFHGGGTPIARWTAGSFRYRLMEGWLEPFWVLVVIAGVLIFGREEFKPYPGFVVFVVVVGLIGFYFYSTS